MKTILYILFAATMMAGCNNSEATKGFDSVDATRFAEVIENEQVQIIDTRTPAEFSEVAKVDKCHRTEVTHLLYPACESHGLAYILYAEFTAIMCSVHNYVVVKFRVFSFFCIFVTHKGNNFSTNLISYERKN